MVVHCALLGAVCYKELELSTFLSFPRVFYAKLTKRQSSVGFCYSGTYCFEKKVKKKKKSSACYLLFILVVC